MECRICSSRTAPFDAASVMGKYEATFSRCPQCGFIQADNPIWIHESYSKPVTWSDVGMVDRTLNLAQVTRAVIVVLLHRRGRFVDYGGGYGLFTRLMRDRGFDFYCFDKYCRNFFAPQFCVNEIGDGNFEMVTAFEVMEHLVDPLLQFTKMLSFSKNILVSTELVPAIPPKLNDWWYYGTEHGQHISFYTLASLQTIAEQNGVSLTTNGRNIHLFSRRKISSNIFKLITTPFFSRLINLVSRNGSLLGNDFQMCRNPSSNEEDT